MAARMEWRGGRVRLQFDFWTTEISRGNGSKFGRVDWNSNTGQAVSSNISSIG